MPKYIAKQSIGQFMPDEEIKGLNAERIQALLVSGAIEEYQEPQKAEADNTAAQLAAEVAGLKAKVEGLEKSLATSEAALKKATAEAKKTASADK